MILKPPKKLFWDQKPTYYERKLMNMKLQLWLMLQKLKFLEPEPETSTFSKLGPETLPPVPETLTLSNPGTEITIEKNSSLSNIFKNLLR